MTKSFQNVEDVIADEAFLAWHFRQSPEHITAWEEWLVSNPSYQPLVMEAGRFLRSFPELNMPVTSATTEERLQQLQQKIADNTLKKARIVSLSGRRWWMAAAALLLALIGIAAFWQYQRNDKRLEAAYGETRTNQLPDGSTMILNANSNASLSKDWEDGKDREVWLEGEAFFKVTKTTSKSRFIVHTKELDIIVTGTQFNVLNRGHKTSVYLSEGSVLLFTRQGKELAMKAGDYVEMNGESPERKAIKEEKALAWKDNSLSFQATPLLEVAQTIQDHYGVKVSFSDQQVSAKTVTGIMANNNLNDLLNAISIAINVSISRSGESIVISEKK